MPKHVQTAVLGHEDCQVANSRSTDSRQQNTDDRNCSGDNVERSTSVHWRTADADDQQRRRLGLVWSRTPKIYHRPRR